MSRRINICLYKVQDYNSVFSYKKGGTRLTAARDKAYQLLTHGRWFSPASSTIKTSRHDIAEILLKVALKHQKINQSIRYNNAARPLNIRICI